MLFLMKNMKKVICVGIYVGFFLILCVCMYAKTNLHTDEVSTYVLSNNTEDDAITVNPDRGIIYDEPERVFLDYMTVKETQRFNYANVWKKQASDVHPPFYYALVHTVCSCFPDVYSKWFAGGINILFAMLTLFLVRKLTREISGKESAEFLVSCSFVFSAGVLSATTFLRMYVVTMFFVTLVAYLILVGGGKNQNHKVLCFYGNRIVFRNLNTLLFYCLFIFCMCSIWYIPFM